MVLKEIEFFWEKANIPISWASYCEKKIKQLYDKYRNLQKGIGSHKAKGHADAEKEFMDQLDDLFDISTKNAMNGINDT